eukprot:TsM_001050100 transcript=TsM_001050100 gene=TsM_001050100
MSEANLFVDFVLVLNAEAENLLPRLLPVRLAKWKVRMAKIEANRKIVADWKAQKRKRIKEERRKAIIKSLNEKRMTRNKFEFTGATSNLGRPTMKGSSQVSVSLSKISPDVGL